MSTTYDSRELRQATAAIGGISGIVRAIWQSIQEWRERDKIRSALAHLSDKELHDIGISRGEIDYVARSATAVDPRDAAADYQHFAM
jgi:uncharacterized protein YjiS (DUF1127 family)